MTRVNYEFECGKLTEHLEMDEPIIKDNHILLIMNKQPGIELFELINDPGLLSIEQRLNLIYKLLITFNEQVIKKKLIHCVIRPENIMVNMVNDLIEVNFVGYSSALIMTDKHKKTEIEPHSYMDPELALNKTLKPDQFSEIYSLGKVFALIICDYIDPERDIYYDFYDFDDLSGRNIHTKATALLYKVKNSRFKDDPSLHPLKILIENMLQPQNHIRMNINQLIDFFENHYSDRMKLIKEKECHESHGINI